jgi:uncharacterized protein YbgA (DUF1722 family)
MTKSVDPQWNKQYQKLVEFQGKNGHCLVPRRYQEDASLADWVSTQRGRHANDTIPLDREVLLNEIGFVLRVPNSAPSWQQQYEKLVEFQRKNGHCIVPQKYEDDKFLGKWVAKQRQLYSKNTIRLDRKKLLDKIGFAWNVNQTWHQQYQKLVAFKQKNGHCLVPKRYQKDASFGEWVITQRQFHKNNKLLRYRKNLLDEIGFVWRVLNSAPARSSTTHVSYRHCWIIISRFIQKICLTLVLVLLLGIGVGFRSDHHQCGTSKRNTRRTGSRTRSRR